MTRTQGLNSVGEVMHDQFVHHDPVNVVFPDDGMTRQEFAEECDINVLLSQYERTGVLNHYNTGVPQYLDVSDVPDLQAAFAIHERAMAAFMTLPANVRKEFDNDPIRFTEFAGDPANLDRMREWNLAPPAPVQEPIPDPVNPLQPKPSEPPAAA